LKPLSPLSRHRPLSMAGDRKTQITEHVRRTPATRNATATAAPITFTSTTATAAATVSLFDNRQKYGDQVSADCALHNMMQDVHTALHEPATDPFTSFTESPSSARSPVYIFCRLRTSCTCSDGSFLCTSSTDVQTPSWDLMWLSVRLHVTMRLGFTYIRLIS